MDFIKPSVGLTDAPFGCLRINEEWFSYISGILRRGEIPGYWLDNDQEALDTITELINQWDTLECGGEVAPMYETICKVALVIDADTLPPTKAANYVQIPYNLVTQQAGLYPTLNGDGTIVLPSGQYELFAWQSYSCVSTGTGAIRFVDGVAVNHESCRTSVNHGNVVMSYQINSDGVTPIQILLYTNVNGRFGLVQQTTYPTVCGVAEFRRVVST